MNVLHSWTWTLIFTSDLPGSFSATLLLEVPHPVWDNNTQRLQNLWFPLWLMGFLLFRVSAASPIDLSADFPLHNLTFPSVGSRGLCCETEHTLGRTVDLVSSWKELHQLRDLVLSFWAVASVALAQAALCGTLIPVFPGLWSVADLLVQGEEQWVQCASTLVITCHVKNRGCRWSCYICLGRTVPRKKWASRVCLCVHVCTCYILNTKTFIQMEKRGQFWGVRSVWLVLTTSTVFRWV